jgi:hypothetical protein
MKVPGFSIYQESAGQRRFLISETGMPAPNEGGDRIREMAYYAPTTTRSRPGVSVILLVYLVAGAIVAATHHYWSNLHSLKQIGSALLATVLWPLILLGINLHIH